MDTIEQHANDSYIYNFIAEDDNDADIDDDYNMNELNEEEEKSFVPTLPASMTTAVSMSELDIRQSPTILRTYKNLQQKHQEQQIKYGTRSARYNSDNNSRSTYFIEKHASRNKYFTGHSVYYSDNHDITTEYKPLPKISKGRPLAKSACLPIPKMLKSLTMPITTDFIPVPKICTNFKLRKTVKMKSVPNTFLYLSKSDTNINNCALVDGDSGISSKKMRIKEKKNTHAVRNRHYLNDPSHVFKQRRYFATENIHYSNDHSLVLKEKKNFADTAENKDNNDSSPVIIEYTVENKDSSTDSSPVLKERKYFTDTLGNRHYSYDPLPEYKERKYFTDTAGNKHYTDCTSLVRNFQSVPKTKSFSADEGGNSNRNIDQQQNSSYMRRKIVHAAESSLSMPLVNTHLFTSKSVDVSKLRKKVRFHISMDIPIRLGINKNASPRKVVKL